MDPNENLREQRRVSREILALNDKADDDGTITDHGTINDLSVELAELVHALDEWIMAGGFLPHDWQPQPAQRPATKRQEPARVKQTACRHCGLDIEGHAPYRAGEWRDRGSNWRCNDDQHNHAPIIESKR